MREMIDLLLEGANYGKLVCSTDLRPLLLRMKALEDVADAARGLSYVNSEGNTSWSVNARDYYNLYYLVKKLDESGK